MSCTALSDTRGGTASAPGKLIGVLRKPTRSRASSNSSPATSSSMDSAREEELHSAIRQLRIQDGDEGYKNTPRMSSTSQSDSASESTSTSTSASSGLNSSTLLDDSWRKDGREKRRIILEEDNSNGGSDFHINHQSPLRTYSAIADRVREQFQQAYASPGTSTTELRSIYIMGNRLIHFLATVLPTHHSYHSKRPEHARLRAKIQHDLMTVREQVEDVAFKLDKEYYRELMAKEGLEFVMSPERMSVIERRKERVRKVKFNLESSQQIVYQVDNNHGVNLNVSASDSFENEAEVIGNTATRRGVEEMDMDMDLAGWGDRDPDIVDLSFSSEEASSSFENSFAIIEGGSEVEGHGSFDFGIGNTRSRTSTGNSQKGSGTLEEEVLNVFGGMDDGWEHYDANKTSDEILEWPEMSGGFPSRADVVCSDEKDKEQDTTGSTADLGDSSVSENDVLNQSSFVADDDDDSDDGTSRSSQDSESTGSDSEADCNVGNSFVNHSFSSDISESFVEKIARENFCRAIDELQDNDDDSAQDSWAQNQQDDLDHSIERQEEPHHVFREEVTLFPEKVAAVRSGLLNHDELESSIDGHDTRVVPILASSFVEDQQPTPTDLPRARDLLKPLHGDQSLDYSNESQSSLEFSYSSSKNCLSTSPEDFTNTEVNSSDDTSKVLNLHDEFDNSQIIAESPSFEYISEDDDEDEDSDHDEFIRSMTEEFTSDQSDSSGAGKTFVTASTTESSRSGMSANELNPQHSKENVLGIIRRDAYIPTIDSPSLPRKQLGDELDYLESKVKDLQVQQSQDYSKGTKENTIPLQVACDEHNVDHNRSIEDLQRRQSLECSKELNQVDCVDSKIIPTDEKSEETNSISNYSRGRRHPTAARLKVLRQSSAWKRRYGKAEKD